MLRCHTRKPSCDVSVTDKTSRGAREARRSNDSVGRISLPEHDACGVGFIAAGDGRPSHEVVRLGLTALYRLRHRGGVAADGLTGDGAGVMTEIPHKLLQHELAGHALRLPARGDYALAFCFFPREASARARAQRLFEEACARYGLSVLIWRSVPVDESVLGPIAAASRPDLWQAVIVRPDSVPAGRSFERTLYLARREFEREAERQPWGSQDAFGHATAGGTPAGESAPYVVSMSSRTVVYKGLLLADDVDRFYLDLRNPEFETRFILFHQRYSTNTTPTWKRAQPYRLLAHNGEINTLQGNVNGIAAREPLLSVPDWPEATRERLLPVIDAGGSDSAMLDNVAELLTLAGRDVRHAFLMLVPEAWEKVPDLPEELKDFYRFHACLSEPWDGPAALVFSDGRWVGARLDRNGLRPMRYTVLDDGMVVAASETGVVDVDPHRVREHGKLGPGQMIAVDLETGRFYHDEEIKAELAKQKPYGEWVRSGIRTLKTSGAGGNASATANASASSTPLSRLMAVFGFTKEELTVVFQPMVENGKEPDGSMGDDTPHAVFSQVHRPLHHYFKQRFAQVTNPPLDHLREELVFSLTIRLGARPNLLTEAPEHARMIELSSPVLTDEQLARLKALGAQDPRFRSAVLGMLFPAVGPDALEPAVAELCRRAEEAVDNGCTILILSDRGISDRQAPIPSLLATGAVHHHLLRAGKRAKVSLVVESGEPRDVHHFATLIGYGAAAVNPYLALAAARELGNEANFIRAVEGGLKKIMSKMGISTLDAYMGAQIFEAIGLAPEVLERCFTGTPCQVGGNGFRELAEDVLYWHSLAFSEEAGASDRLQKEEGAVEGDGASSSVIAGAVKGYGFYKFKKDGEVHEFNPEVVRALHRAVRERPIRPEEKMAETSDLYRHFSRLVHGGPPSQIRDLLDFRSDRPPISVDEVEPVEEIVRRLSTGAMSLGALSPEAHETLAIAMNRLGARSNSGEGGEDPSRYGTERNSAVKQVASGRFGVTPAYLASAIELQIKMAQGAKPGEGGQIPGHKVTELIARLRYAVPGVPLISPPPHHDIYSIEDLAQLIYDLKQANPKALVSVKLVAETGVGIIAAGVAKGYADIVVISGHSGGTGSSPLSSIKHAGLPWELGLVETQRMLVANGLRSRVTVRVDGGLKTGRDVVIAALLGADEYSFGTSAMVAEGCQMARVCHTNTCPVGIATQQERLRQKFPGTPEHVITYFLNVAQEVREILAKLGYRSLDEVIGRSDLLVQRPTGLPRIDRIDLGALLVPAASLAGDATAVMRRTQLSNPLPPEDALGRRIAEELRDAIEEARPVQRIYEIRNTDRTVGATVAWEIARRYGDRGLPPGSVRLEFRGVAGQSFGAFCVSGMSLKLVGRANDYVGKGMAGGEIVICPEPGAPTAPERNVIVGNTVLYGATGGALFCAGAAGERFAVRNSGAVAVVEGVGDHGCEYMTGGTVVVLGRVGRNFGAGMTNGKAFVYDPEGLLSTRYHQPSVRIERLPGTAGGKDGKEGIVEELRALIVVHAERTGSPRAKELLNRWDEVLPHFWRVIPLAAEAMAGQAGEVAKRQSAVVASGSDR
ncbi:MAG: Glutamate synthase [NADPH] large chain [Hydrogenibacillus schlegelii]|uniref:Glutamate synthase [NADPH] large chain n=1 Tax=Hydrogenibacillus schlegelii TaxID=1484 RepID=A0A2T5G7Y0_HYDSH|nr:glutamate synthase large subunit [Hydrogenibacillus schlegelii]PTQ52294.1 MAG: Glutamate synthase [NADPH] large chain [Hydrogenibacillus schlegelii]